tara:strand:+ start:30341 stop:30850 length:510 start_codon:yes stop_codon:yes gene_type:complete
LDSDEVSYSHLVSDLNKDQYAEHRLPPDLERRQFDPSCHPISARTLLNLAYQSGGGDVRDTDDWWNEISRDAEFDIALCLAVFDRNSDQLVAFAHGWTSGFVKDIAVHPDFRRSGLGQFLVRELARVFLERGFCQMSLKVMRDNPHGALSFYSALGFKPLETSEPVNEG